MMMSCYPERNRFGQSRSRDIALSVLDQSMIRAGQDPAEAIAETIELARAAERFGYRRYWLAEHHSSDAFAGTAPEILLAHLAAVTSTMRIGSGGIMLSHYSPLKVAEVFRVLHALHPERIDMGIGRAAAGPGTTTHSLRQRSLPVGSKKFCDQLADLLAFLAGRTPWPQKQLDVQAQPKGPSAPDPWLVGSGHHAATLAAHFGCALSFTHFINAESGVAAMRYYRRNFRPSTWLSRPRTAMCVSALCADTEREAHRLALSHDLWELRAGREAPGPLPPIEEAEAQTYTAQERLLIANGRRNRIVGTPEQVRVRLLELALEYGADEMMVVTLCFDPAARLRSYELLAQTFNLRHRMDAPARQVLTPAGAGLTEHERVLLNLPAQSANHTFRKATHPVGA